VFGGKYDRKALLTRSRRWMRRTYGRKHWEWGYFSLQPKLYVEEMILDENGGYGTTEAKFYVYSGKVVQIVMIYDRQLAGSAQILDASWKPSTGANTIGLEISVRPRPKNYRQLEETALKLCHPFDQMRCDLYVVGSKIFFGEYTVYNRGGYVLLQNDQVLKDAHGDAWDIRQSWFLTTPQSGLRSIYARSLLELLNAAEAG
jgi:hypothetical protein